MNGVEDILAYAWNKDAVNLATALDDVMSAKVIAAVDDMQATVAAQMFGQSIPEDHEELTDHNDEELTDDNQ